MIGRAAQKTSGAPNRATEEHRNRGGAKQSLLSLGVNNRSHFQCSIGAKAAERVSAAFAVLCFVPWLTGLRSNSDRTYRTYKSYSKFSRRRSLLRCPRQFAGALGQLGRLRELSYRALQLRINIHRHSLLRVDAVSRDQRLFADFLPRPIEILVDRL